MIRVLDNATINKIAAGEVVEGPFSVVKELVENAIDAEATAIILEIREGGKKLIRITDNGIGIPENEVEIAFLRHATSKITELEDLESIQSLGFRGEALASIAAISQLEIITRPKDQPHGISLELVGGKVVGKKAVGCPQGTTLLVKNIFYNTPARLKFMKSTPGETGKITEMFTRLALSKPNISFKYINNNNIMFTTPGNGSLQQTILSVFDRELFKQLIPIEGRWGNTALEGFISQPTYLRGNRNYEILFINGRFVKHKGIYQAIENAYRERLPINKFPLCILNLSVDPSELDVNVHPTKTEVKLEREEEIKAFIQETVERALTQEVLIPKITIQSSPAPSMPEKEVTVSIPISAIPERVQEAQGVYPQREEQQRPKQGSSFTSMAPVPERKQMVKEALEQLVIEKALPPKFPSPGEVQDPQQEPVKQQNFVGELLAHGNYIGQLFKTYLIIEMGEAMYLIDQHAAHERILYNQFKAAFEVSQVMSQGLVAPQILTLPPEDYDIFMAHAHEFSQLGFEIENFGQHTIIIRAVPLIMGAPRSFDFLLDFIDELKTGYQKEQSFHEKLIQRSCKEAIKGLDALDRREVMALLKDLSYLTPPLTCPHGRPILLTLTKYEIEKHFKRIQ